VFGLALQREKNELFFTVKLKHQIVIPLYQVLSKRNTTITLSRMRCRRWISFL